MGVLIIACCVGNGFQNDVGWGHIGQAFKNNDQRPTNENLAAQTILCRNDRNFGWGGRGIGTYLDGELVLAGNKGFDLMRNFLVS